jgi:hypothetical protein
MKRLFTSSVDTEMESRSFDCKLKELKEEDCENLGYWNERLRQNILVQSIGFFFCRRDFLSVEEHGVW